MTDTLTPELMLYAYSNGIFPMAESAESDDLFWCDPDMRGIIPLGGFHVSRSLKRAMKKRQPHPIINKNFRATVQACANRSETWINAELFDLYDKLHALGAAHAFEVYDGERRLGGVFGLTIGGAFFGESMFSDHTDGSKMALALLVDHLNAKGFRLFDTQFLTDHLASLGAIEIPRSRYHATLAEALIVKAKFV